MLNSSKSPLCGKPLLAKGNSITAYPIYRVKAKDNVTGFKLLLFLTFTIIILSVSINILTYNLHPILWSPIIAMGLMYLWVAVKVTFLTRNHIGRKILVHYVALSIFLLVIDQCSGFKGWSTNYVIPLFGIVATFLMTALAIRNQSLWKSDIGYILAMFFINVIPTVLFLFDFSSIIWPSVAAIIFSVITILGMIIFYQRRFKNELQKRFHF